MDGFVLFGSCKDNSAWVTNPKVLTNDRNINKGDDHESLRHTNTESLTRVSVLATPVWLLHLQKKPMKFQATVEENVQELGRRAMRTPMLDSARRRS
jgi:hypothetical protein